MINCEVCGNEFEVTLEEGRPLPRYTHCDECFTDWMLESFKGLHDAIDGMKTQSRVD